MPVFIYSFGRFLRRALSDLLSSIGSNNLGVWFPALPAILWFVYQTRQNGWQAMKHDIVVGLIITACSYGALFIYVSIRNVYREHIALARRVSVFSQLQIDAFSLASEIRDFLEEIGPKPIANPEAYKDSPNQVMASIIGTNRVVSPWMDRLTNRFGKDFAPRVKEIRF